MWLTLNHRHTPNDWNVFGASNDMLIRRYYENRLRRELVNLPDSVCFMLTAKDVADAPKKTTEVARWCCALGVGHVTFRVDSMDPDVLDPFLKEIRNISDFARLSICGAGDEPVRGDSVDVNVVIGMSGKEEIVRCIRNMAEDGVDPGDVDEEMIESHLRFRYEPDLVIKTGGSHLTDFLIWQSIYSELFFTDVNWSGFRRTDLVRALRDYQTRKRRYGR